MPPPRIFGKFNNPVQIGLNFKVTHYTAIQQDWLNIINGYVHIWADNLFSKENSKLDDL